MVVNHWKLSQQDYDDGAVIDFDGFSTHMSFKTFDNQQHDTMRIIVGKVEKEKRVMMLRSDNTS